MYAIPSFENATTSFLMEKGSNYGIKKELRSAIAACNWQKFMKIGRAGLENGNISLDSIESLAKELRSELALNAFRGSESLLRLHKKANISLPDSFTLAAFIECILPTLKGYYFSHEKYNIPRTIEIDRHTRNIFIHLGTNGVKLVGKGNFKVVTKTVYYQTPSSVIYAHTATSANIDCELATMRALSKVPGVLMLESAFKHADAHGHVTTSFITPIYFPGSLKKFLSSDSQLRFKDKVKIASAILGGLAGMHKLGYTHRSLSTDNQLVDIRFILGRKVISAVIADLGRAMLIKNAHGIELKGLSAQANSSYLSPEAFFKDNMSGSDYLKSDIYAMGCVLWNLYFEQETPWGESIFFKKHKLSYSDRQKQHIACQKKAIAALKKKMKNLEHTSKGTYLSIMLKMLRIHPEARGTAQEHADRMEHLSRLVP
jgi:serine/threonine protein kinase